MAACKQLSRKIHLQSTKQASQGVLERLKSLIGIDNNLQGLDVTHNRYYVPSSYVIILNK